MKFLASALTLVFSLSIASALPTAVPREANKFSRLIVFGDSFSDNGNGSWVATKGKWPVDPAYFHHSFSNGPKWNEVAAKSLGLQLINLATGGATTNNVFVQGGTGSDSSIDVPSGADQVAGFLSWDKPRPGDVFVHWLGANDILFNTSITGAQAASYITKNVDKLVQAGAKNIVLANYNDVTTFPGTFNSPDYKSPTFRAYSKDLTNEMKKVVKHFSKRAKTGFVDVGGLFHSITSNPGAYGFEAKYLHPPTACLIGVYKSDNVPRHLCNDPGRHVFFDSYHPAKEVHDLVGNLFVKEIKALAK